MLPPLIEASRAVRAKLRAQRTSPLLLTMPTLRATLPMVELLLESLEDLHDRVALLEGGRTAPVDARRVAFELET